MIISASRRTDIPALYSEWFMNRARAGWCQVPNPMNTKQVPEVSLQPRDVDAIVFWSKNPRPMLTHLAELDSMGHRYYFQYTLNDYPLALEPQLPTLEARLDTFKALSRHLGPDRVRWRYDPIIISPLPPSGFHVGRFRTVAEELDGAIRRVMVSIVDFYKKTERRLGQLEKEGFLFDQDPTALPEVPHLLTDLAATAKRHGMEIFTCAEDRDCTEFGIPPGRCIDDHLLRSIWSLGIQYRKDPYQRESCLCRVSKDIGINDTCIHGCPYCYATRNYDLAKRRHEEHDPSAPALWGHYESAAKVSEAAQGRLL